MGRAHLRAKRAAGQLGNKPGEEQSEQSEREGRGELRKWNRKNLKSDWRQSEGRGRRDAEGGAALRMAMSSAWGVSGGGRLGPSRGEVGGRPDTRG